MTSNIHEVPGVPEDTIIVVSRPRRVDVITHHEGPDAGRTEVRVEPLEEYARSCLVVKGVVADA